MDGASNDSGPKIVLAQTIEAQCSAVCDGVAACRRELKRRNVRALRVALRRLLGALELAGGAGCDAKPRLGRRVVRLLRSLGPLRDAQRVTRQAKRFMPEFDAGEVTQLCERLAVAERQCARIARKCLMSFDVDEFRYDVSKVTVALRSTGTDSCHRGALEAALRGKWAVHHLRIARQQQCLPVDDAHALHELRLSIKSYRYALDAVPSLLPVSAQELSRLAARVQDLLGVANDAYVLARSVRRQVNERPRLLGLARLVEALERESSAAQREGVRQAKSATLDWPW